MKTPDHESGVFAICLGSTQTVTLGVCSMQIGCEEIVNDMTEKPIEFLMVHRLEEEQKKTNARLDTIDGRLFDVGKDVGELKGTIRPPTETPWWIRFIVAPLVVAASIAVASTVTIEYVKISQIESFLQENGGFIVGLRLQRTSTDPSNQTNIAEAQHVLSLAKTRKIR